MDSNKVLVDQEQLLQLLSDQKNETFQKVNKDIEGRVRVEALQYDHLEILYL